MKEKRIFEIQKMNLLKKTDAFMLCKIEQLDNANAGASKSWCVCVCMYTLYW